MEALKGDQTPCVVVGTYGNRHYDDAVVALSNMPHGMKETKKIIEKFSNGLCSLHGIEFSLLLIRSSVKR